MYRTRASALLTFLALLALLGALGAQSATTGKLKVKADPGRAGVFVDGKYLGPAANFGRTRTYTLPPGSHKVVLREPRYKDATLQATVEAGKTVTLESKLEALPEPKPPFGKIKTKDAPKYTAVYVDDMFVGHADEFDNFAQGIQIQPGEYRVKLVSQDGMNSREEKVTVRADMTTEVRWPGK
jgi:hypothetical protein